MTAETGNRIPGSTQRKIIRYLAVNTPKTINQISKALGLDYAYTNKTVKKLVRSEYLEPVQSKHYRGRTFQRYWLTDEALLHAVTLIDYSEYLCLLESAAEMRQRDTLFDEKIAFLLDLAKELDKDHFHLFVYYLDVARRRAFGGPVPLVPSSVFLHAEFLEPWTRAALKHHEYLTKIKQLIEELKRSLNLIYEILQQSGEDPRKFLEESNK